MTEFLTAPALTAPGIRHGFFTRAGGVSDGVLAGLNIGLGSQDDPARVQENRRRAMVALDQPEEALSTLYQIHSATALTLDAPIDPANRPEGDGMATDRPGIALGIATADCAPILFADPDAGVIGACHAGWKGAVTGVIANTVAAMERLGAKRDRMAAALGPCIHQASYEVGPEFQARFVEAAADNAQYFIPSGRVDHFRFDLLGYVLSRLDAEGLAQVEHVAEDTYADAIRFYSYRRATHRDERGADGRIDYGRLLSAIVLTG